MDATVGSEVETRHQKTVGNYFQVWKDLNVNGISRIFSSDARYEIRNKQKIYKGIEAIEGYWCRNARRQVNPEIRWSLSNETDLDVRAFFSATFYDSEERQIQLIEGAIDFSFNSKDQISILSETYKKSVIDVSSSINS